MAHDSGVAPCEPPGCEGCNCAACELRRKHEAAAAPKQHALCGKCMTPHICAEDGPGCAPAVGVPASPEKEQDAVDTLTEEGWIWDGDQWQRPPRGVTAVQGPICENCKGSGMVHISIMGDGQDEPCKTCHGTGRLPAGVMASDGGQPE